MIIQNGVGITTLLNGETIKAALNAANETVNRGIYNPTTLSAVDADLQAGNIKLAEVIFGFVGTLAPGALAEDFIDAVIWAVTQDLSGSVTTYWKAMNLGIGGDLDLVSSTQNYAAVSLAIAVTFLGVFNSPVNDIKLRLFMDGAQVAESAFLVDATAYALSSSRAMSGAGKICKATAHNYSGIARTLNVICENKVGGRGYSFISVGNVELV